MTAEHCGNTQTYAGIYALTFRKGYAGSSGDVQNHSVSSHTTGARFYYNRDVTRVISATANPVSGQRLCVYGKTTGATCDDVYKLNQCSGVDCGLAMAHRHYTASGDSGGPWYWGNTGYGVHHGYKTVTLIERSLFTPVRAGASALGMTVKLG